MAGLQADPSLPGWCTTQGKCEDQQNRFTFCFLAALRGMRDLSSQGSHSHPLHWKCGVLTAGPPGKSQNRFTLAKPLVRARNPSSCAFSPDCLSSFLPLSPYIP